MRVVRYREIAEAIRADVVAGTWPAGRLMPSESELSARFSVSRVTVRRSLELLRDEGLLSARQGFGWFVSSAPVRQSLGHLGTIEEQMAASGLRPVRKVLEFGFVRAVGRVFDVLASEQVLRVRRVNLADDQPFAVVTVWCPSDLGGALSRDRVEASPFYDLLPGPLGGATQTIAAAAAARDDAALLEVPVGSPVLRCERITHDTAGRRVLFSEFVFPGHMTEFVVEMAHVGLSIAPSGLRLVAE